MNYSDLKIGDILVSRLNSGNKYMWLISSKVNYKTHFEIEFMEIEDLRTTTSRFNYEFCSITGSDFFVITS